MKLVDLKPKWLRWSKEKVDPTQFFDGILSPSGERVSQSPADSLADAHGIRFKCPLCVEKDGHGVVCWFEGRVPDEAQPGPGRWTPQGTGFEDLTFVPGAKIQAVSVQLIGGCNWHGFVRNGEVTPS